MKVIRAPAMGTAIRMSPHLPASLAVRTALESIRSVSGGPPEPNAEVVTLELDDEYDSVLAELMCSVSVGTFDVGRRLPGRA